ncbi:MAG: CoA-binding protein [Alphaproteobacteria bacterium]|nr:CoA-binding protein [Alphaproteobacteria bacterium]
MAHAASSREDDPLRYLAHHDYYSDEKLRGILSSIRTFAMVGASTNWKRPSFYAMKYLSKKGYRVIPVNPSRAGDQILGETVYGSIAEVPHRLDMVDIFRTSEEALAITKEVIANKDEKGIKVLWMQLTVRNDPAAELAEEAGLTVIMDRCPKIEFARLSGELSWCGINSRIVSAKTLKAPNA